VFLLMRNRCAFYLVSVLHHRHDFGFIRDILSLQESGDLCRSHTLNLERDLIEFLQ
jgi:hypothetical protein